MEYKVTKFQASCRKVRGYPTNILVNLIENNFKVTISQCNISYNCNVNIIYMPY